MSTSSKNRTETIRGVETVLPYFGSAPENASLRLGAELELMLVKRTRTGALLTASDYENQRLTDNIIIRDPRDEKGDSLGRSDFSNEPPASMIELKTAPHSLKQIHNVPNQMDAIKAVLTHKLEQLEITADELAEAAGTIAAANSPMTLPDRPLYRGELLLCPFAVVPFATPGEMMANIISARRGPDGVPSDRPRLLMQSFSRVMDGRAVPYPVTNSAVHATHGVKDPRHAFEMSRLLAAMMPFLFVLTENRPPYQSGSEQRQNVHTGILMRSALNLRTPFNAARRGLYPAALWQAKDAGDFIRRMADTVLKAPMLAFWDHEGRYVPAPCESPPSPQDMKGLGPENISQFELAMSQFWWCFKYKFQPGEKGALLHELRDFDSGPATVANISLIMGMPALDDAVRRDLVGRLESKYGIPLMSNPGAARRVIGKNLHAALHRGDARQNPGAGGRFLLTPFGSRGHTMLDFLKQDLLPMLEEFYRGTRMANRIPALRFMAESVTTDAQFWNDCFSSPQAQTKGILDLTEDPENYHHLHNEGKSWPQLHAEGKLPFLKPAAPGS